MANKIFSNLLGYLKLNDDEDDEYTSDFLDEKPRERTAIRSTIASEPYMNDAKRFTKTERVIKREDDPVIVNKEQRPIRMERTTTNKVVPIRTTPKGFEVCVFKPNTFEDSQDICDMLLSGRAAIVNLEGFDPEDAQRVMDFISGSVYAINGKLHQISRYIFIFSPDTVDISGDFLELMEGGFDVPTLNKEF